MTDQQRARDKQRLAQLESQWAQLTNQVAQERRTQMQRAAYQRQAQLIAAMDRAVNPPPEPEPEVICVSEEDWGTGRLGCRRLQSEAYDKTIAVVVK
jgi:hypothetical protein